MVRLRVRLVFTVVILMISLAALAWSFLPGARIVRRQKIQPTEMQLPTPSGFILSGRSLAELDYFNEIDRSVKVTDRFVLLI
jgi:hypothetical protein